VAQPRTTLEAVVVVVMPLLVAAPEVMAVVEQVGLEE
jgi:hypothetical protein